MKLGILSDSHGRLLALRAGLRLLEEHGAEAFIHCGDIGGIEAIEELAGRKAWFVWGNTDDAHPPWREHVIALGLPWPDGPLDLRLGGKRIAVCHGHEPECRRIIEAAEHDYLLYGHTHERADERIGRMRMINPGALHRVAVKTVALLDTESDTLQYFELS